MMGNHFSFIVAVRFCTAVSLCCSLTLSHTLSKLCDVLRCKRATKIFLLHLEFIFLQEISATRAISYASKAQSNLLNRLFVEGGLHCAGIGKEIVDFLTTQFPYSIYMHVACSTVPSIFNPIVTLSFHLFRKQSREKKYD